MRQLSGTILTIAKTTKHRQFPQIISQTLSIKISQSGAIFKQHHKWKQQITFVLFAYDSYSMFDLFFGLPLLGNNFEQNCKYLQTDT